MSSTSASEAMPNTTASVVASNLRATMRDKRWSGRSLALALGLQPMYVQRRMSGDVELSATDLKVFADQLEVRVQDFFREPRAENGGRLIGVGSTIFRTVTGHVVGPEGFEPPTSTVESRHLAKVTHLRPVA